MKQEVIKKAYEAAVAKNADPRVIEALKGKLDNADEKNNDSEFDSWMKQRQSLELNYSEASKNLKKITGDNKGGITPDEIKESKEYKVAREAQQKAFKALQDFNAKSPNEFKKRASKFSNSADENKCNAMDNAMDKITAMKKKILLSNASDDVKAKAIKKVMSNATDRTTVLPYSDTVDSLNKVAKIIEGLYNRAQQTKDNKLLSMIRTAKEALLDAAKYGQDAVNEHMQ